MFAYPKTLHIRGSKGIVEDDQIAIDDLTNCERLVVEEKLDGSEVSINFAGGKDNVYHRNNPVQGPAFHPFWEWFYARRDALFERLGFGKVLFGEWLYAKHTEFYDALPSYFIAYDIWDIKANKWLTTQARLDLLEGVDIEHVPVLYEGQVPSDTRLFDSLLRQPSMFKSEDWLENMTQQAVNKGYDPERISLLIEETDTSRRAEGLYIKAEGQDEVIGWYKYIRSAFLQTILDSDTHWEYRSIFPNQLAQER